MKIFTNAETRTHRNITVFNFWFIWLILEAHIKHTRTKYNKYHMNNWRTLQGLLVIITMTYQYPKSERIQSEYD